MKIGINLHEWLLLVIHRFSRREKYAVLILAFLVSFPMSSYSKSYYFSSSTGNDSYTSIQAQNPATPWKTIDQLNRSMNLINAGDFILFKRGDTFYGTIKISRSGLSGSPIIIGAFGTGNNPIITGFTTITVWTNEGNGIYSHVISSEDQTNIVTIDGVNVGMGRYPKATFLNYESFSTNISITDDGLGDATDWAGAEVVIRKNDWTLDRCLITDHSGDKLSYTSLGSTQNATANYGYFIQNDLRCVTKYGDWYHDTRTGKFYMYFGDTDPSTTIVKVATKLNLINASGYQYLTLENLTFTGSISNMINFKWIAHHCVIRNCKLAFSGADGISLYGEDGVVDNNEINDCSGYGIYIYGANALITNNILNRIGLIEGQSKGWLRYVGIFVEKDGCVIQHNRIESVGYNCIAIGASANNIKVKNNFINKWCLNLNDGGGIYLSGTHSSVIIDGNIILNGIGNTKGTPNVKSMAEGIYLDEKANHIAVINNTIASCSNSGIKLHKAYENIIEGNTTFNNFGGMNFENWTLSNTISNNILRNNIFFANETSQFALRYSSTANDILSFGLADNNYYARPIDDNRVFHVYDTSVGYKDLNLVEWQSVTKQDKNSLKSPVSIEDINTIEFEFNDSKTPKTVRLNKPMIDIKGRRYVNEVLLLPFTSIILLVDPDPLPETAKPVFVSAVIENANPSQLEIAYTIDLANIVPDVSVFEILVNSTACAVKTAAISGKKVLLYLSRPVKHGDIVTFSYTEPDVNSLQTSAGGNAASVYLIEVSNKVEYVSSTPVEPNPTVKINTPPVLVINSPESSFSGFVNEISAADSYDLDQDNLTFTWSAPASVPISSTKGTTIKYLGPVVSKPTIFEFKVSVNDGKTTTQNKLVPIEILPYKPELEDAEMIKVEASGFQPPNYPFNIMDGDPGTIWSSNGEDQWLIIELKQLYSIDHVKIAFQPGRETDSFFDVLGSSNKVNWEPILTKSESCKFSGNLQVFDFPHSKSEQYYKYIKLVGHTNSVNNWNNISEFMIFGFRHPTQSLFEQLPATISPNPTNGLVKIKITEAISEIDIYRIIDFSGTVVFQEKVDPGTKEFSVQPNLKNGIYFVQLCLGNVTVFSEKLLVIH